MGSLDPDLVAPCGMDCGICSGHLALVHDVRGKGVRMTYCRGCRPRDKQCAFLKRGCELLREGRVGFCFECPDYPCTRLEQLDERYRKNFKMSMIENLELIRDRGVEGFLEKERERWGCPRCGGTVCCHNGLCFSCGIDELRGRRQRYRWE